ncbi:unnamed protein product, partial [Mesorhabditis spiculigera]
MSAIDCENDPGWRYLRQSREEMLADQSRPYDSKKDCWVPDEDDGFVAAQIQSAKGDMVTVVTKSQSEKTLKKELIQEMNPPKFEKTEDMSNLSFLNDASVLHNLRARYAAMLIYTYSGLFCVVINPYKRLPIYTDSVARLYMSKRKTEMPPHLFSVSDEAYRNMLIDHENQSMLITGESGAGKTENTKKVIAYFAAVGAKQNEAEGIKSDDGGKKATLEDQIVQTNPVLEAFGNAKTVRNNNSSRFGKFIRIHFSKLGRVASCDIEHYLLEKSRVIRQAPGERCYHIFYQIYSNYKPELKKELLLDLPIKDYWFVAQAELTVDGIDDVEEMQATDEAFTILNFTDEEKMDCYRLMSAHMHMGNMKFKQRPREEQADADGTDEAEKAAAMYGIDMEKFLNALMKPRVRVGTEWVSKGQNCEQVNWAKGAMAKGLYNRVFNWIVKKCNATLDQQGVSRDHFIGVLDIAGFEIFDMNSFEQLWINFVNEKLQQFFNHHMFVLEQEEYAREGIQWTFIDFGLDLEACIKLIEQPMGIISMLDEECIVPKATDLTLAQKLVEQHLGKHPNFEKPKPPKGKQAEAHFAMRHYAGTVRYNVLNWLEKNKDPLNDTVVSTFKQSTGNALLVEIWQDYQTQEEAAEAQKAGGAGGGKKKGKSGSMMTVSMLYRESLNNLMTMLNKTHPHFIRCIIPNEKKQSGVLDAALVMNQLTCNGVLEGIRICRKGFPNRMMHPDFVQRYAIVAAEQAKSSPDPRKCADAIMGRLVNEGHVTSENFNVGLTKVFFKAGILAALEDVRDLKMNTIFTGFQAAIRQYLGATDKKRRTEQRTGLLIIQRNVKSWCGLRTWEWFKLYGKVKPMIYASKFDEQIEALEAQMKELQGSIDKESQARQGFETQNAAIIAEKEAMLTQLEQAKSDLSQNEQKLAQLESAQSDASRQLADLQDRLAEAEDANSEAVSGKKRVENELGQLRKQIQDMQMSLRKVEAERTSKDHQIRSLHDEMQQQEDTIAKLTKEKKHQEEQHRKLMEDLASEEDKVNHSNKVKSKLESTLDELEEALEREKRNKADAEKEKRKLDGEVKVLNENIDEASRQKNDLDNNLKRKEQELHNANNRLEDESALVSKLQRQIKEQQARIHDLEEEAENERASRQRADRARSDMQSEIQDLQSRVDEQGGATATQAEMNKKRDAELAQLRREVEEGAGQFETAMSALRKRNNDAVTEISEQIEALKKAKAKAEKEKASAQRDAEGVSSQLDQETSQKVQYEKLARSLEEQISELMSRVDDQGHQIHDFTSQKNRLSGQNGDLGRQLEDLLQQIDQVQRVKAQIVLQLDEAKRAADDEARERQMISAQARNYQHDAEQMRSAMEEATEERNDVNRQISKANQEAQQLKSRFEGEGMLLGDEIEEAKRKQGQKLTELQDQIATANAKIQALDKQRGRLTGELDDAQVEADRQLSYAASLEKKQKDFDGIVGDWKKRADDLAAEVDRAQREARGAITEMQRAKAVHDEATDVIDGLRRENKALGSEIKDLSDQLGEGGRSVHEMQKIIRRLETEKEELQKGLDEAENALEAEEAKVMRAQVEVSQIRAEIEKRIQEKEAEFESTRKNHQKALESMTASIQTESRSKAEMLKSKKKLEGDINDLEIALDHANKANSDIQKSIKKVQEQIRDSQLQVEDEQRQRDELRDQFFNANKRGEMLQGERDDLKRQLNANEADRRQAEQDAASAREAANDALSQVTSANSMKRKLEGEIQAIHSDIDDTMKEFRHADENAKRAISDASRLAEELKQQQDASRAADSARQHLEGQTREFKVRLDEAEALALKGGKKTIAKLEQRNRELEAELNTEQARYQNVVKEAQRNDKRVRELQFQIDEDKKNFARLNDVVEKLNSKIRAQKGQIEDAEELANANLQKLRDIQGQLDSAEERADSAEQSLTKLRSRSRTAVPGLQNAVFKTRFHFHEYFPGIRLRRGDRPLALPQPSRLKIHREIEEKRLFFRVYRRFA